MNNFEWILLKYENGGNPYIIKTKKEFDRIKRKYKNNLIKIKNDFYIVKEKQKENTTPLF